MTARLEAFITSRGGMAFLCLMSALPLLWPDVPPLSDVPVHMGRYAVQLRIDEVAALRQWYDFQWGLVGNLGVDLLVVPLSSLFGLELAVKLIVISIPVLTVLGLLLLARQIHGRVPATVLFALPLAYAYPFQYGFINFSLALAFALLAFWGWLVLAARLRTRSALFLLLSALVWLCHFAGWAILCVLCFSAELTRAREAGTGLAKAIMMAGLQCLPLATPIALVLWSMGGGGPAETGDWFNVQAKAAWLAMLFRDRWKWFDVGAVIVLALLIYHGLRHASIRMAAIPATAAVLLLALYILLPRSLIGASYVDMRLLPVLFMMALLALAPKPALSPAHWRMLALAGVAFFAARTAATSVSFALHDRAFDRTLGALRQLPAGSVPVTFVGMTCEDAWSRHRMDHIGSMALVRRNTFANDQMVVSGGLLLTVKYPAAGDFMSDPSQYIVSNGCSRPDAQPLSDALDRFPRAAFDHVWIVNRPPGPPPDLTGLILVWSSGRDALYRIEKGPDQQRLAAPEAAAIPPSQQKRD